MFVNKVDNTSYKIIFDVTNTSTRFKYNENDFFRRQLLAIEENKFYSTYKNKSKNLNKQIKQKNGSHGHIVIISVDIHH